VSASIPAAVISMAILRILGGSTILENNVVQTIASAGEAVAAGAIFTFPALVILGGVRTLPYVEVTALCIVGATMGALLVVFLRRRTSSRSDCVSRRRRVRAGASRRRCAGECSPASCRRFDLGGSESAAGRAGVIPGAVSGARWIGSAAIAGSLDISAALIGVGYIIGIRIAALVFAGGAFAWLVVIPVLTAFHSGGGTGDAATTAQQLWSGQVRYLGVGAMLTGGVVTLWKLRTRIASAIADSIRVVRATNTSVATAREDTDLSARAVLTAVALCVPVIFAICLWLSGNVALSAALAILLTLICFSRRRSPATDRNSRCVEQSGVGRDSDRVAGGGALSQTGRVSQSVGRSWRFLPARSYARRCDGG